MCLSAVCPGGTHAPVVVSKHLITSDWKGLSIPLEILFSIWPQAKDSNVVKLPAKDSRGKTWQLEWRRRSNKSSWWLGGQTGSLLKAMGFAVGDLFSLTFDRDDLLWLVERNNMMLEKFVSKPRLAGNPRKRNLPASCETENLRSLSKYKEFELRAREALYAEVKARSIYSSAEEAAGFARRAVDKRDAFVQLLLRSVDNDGGAPSEAAMYEATLKYIDMLRETYGPQLVLDPIVLSASQLTPYDYEGLLHKVRILQRRFIVYRPEGCSTANGWASKPQHSQWDDTTLQSWLLFLTKISGVDGRRLLAEEVHNSTDVTALSCNSLMTVWDLGLLSKTHIADHESVLECVEKNQTSKEPNRLYVTDVAIPSYLENCVPVDAAGICCAVDSSCNAVFAPAIRTDRSTSLLNLLKVESTGTASWVLFAPVGRGSNLTGFHQETKKRRSYNCGSRDLIVQPLATVENHRKVEELHMSVLGSCARHICLLPLEMYLQAGIPLVMYVRDKGYSELVELPEQSNHAFITFGYAPSMGFQHDATVGKPVYPHSLKVSCNDWCLLRELSSAYLLEKLDAPLHKLGMGSGVPTDGADSWIDSSFLAREPYLKRHRPNNWKRPWQDELLMDSDNGCQGNQITEEQLQTGPRQGADQRNTSMDFVLVRTVERLVDAYHGRLNSDVPLTRSLPSPQEAKVALLDALPCLLDLAEQATSEGHNGKCNVSGQDGFSAEYLTAVQQDVLEVLQDVPLIQQEAFDVSALNATATQPHLFLRYMMEKDHRDIIADAAERVTKSELLLCDPDVARSHWLLCLRREWEASLYKRSAAKKILKWHQRRCMLEQTFDTMSLHMVQGLGNSIGDLIQSASSESASLSI
eukprot:jgi/Botrbrau1/10799/Bobra.0064s0005.1